MKKLIVLILVLAVLVYGAMPYIAVAKLTRALENEDAITVDQIVDFDAVQASLQDDFAMRMGIEPQSANAADRLANSLSHMFLSMAVTPQAMVYVFKEKPRRDSMGLSTSPATLLSHGDWSGPGTFIMNNAQGQPTLLLVRRGALNWEIVGLRLK